MLLSIMELFSYRYNFYYNLFLLTLKKKKNEQPNDEKYLNAVLQTVLDESVIIVNNTSSVKEDDVFYNIY